MPKYVCRKCHREFWGWGVHHQKKSGVRVACPDCNGSLVLQKENNREKGTEKRVMKGSTAA